MGLIDGYSIPQLFIVPLQFFLLESLLVFFLLLFLLLELVSAYVCPNGNGKPNKFKNDHDATENAHEQVLGLSVSTDLCRKEGGALCSHVHTDGLAPLTDGLQVVD